MSGICYNTMVKTFLKWTKKALVYAVIVSVGTFLSVLIIVHFTTTPSNSRMWALDQTILPYAEINGSEVTLHNIRNFTYASTTIYTPHYYTKTFDLSKIKRVWYIVEPFSGFIGSAHTFLSFEFEGDTFVSISVEIRKELGETFSAWRGLFNQYELMYVVADERDVVKLRSNYRKDLVYVYPVKTSKEKAEMLFMDMIERVNKLKDTPEFYNTLTNTCTTNIVRHVNTITENKIPLSYKIILPSYSDKLAFDLGLLDTDLSFEKARERFLVNSKAEAFASSTDFSVKIRN